MHEPARIPRRVTLDALAEDPSMVAALPAADRLRLLMQAAGVVEVLRAPLHYVATPAHNPDGPEWIEPDEAARICHASRRWVLEQARTEAWKRFTSRPSHKVLLIERRGLLRWLGSHK